MKYLKQFLIIILISLVGELLSYLIPVTIPPSIYGMIILFILLCTGVLKLDQVKETGHFLIEIIGIMFIPATVGIINLWDMVASSLVLYILVFLVSTVVVMGATAISAQAVSRRKGDGR